MDEDFIDAVASAIADHLWASNALPPNGPQAVRSASQPAISDGRNSDMDIDELSEVEIEALAEQIVTKLSPVGSYEDIPAEKIEI